MASTLVYVNGLANDALDFFNTLDVLLTNPFSAIPTRGLGWQSFFTYSATDKLYFSLGSSQSERIYLRLTVGGSNTYIDRKTCQFSRTSDGYMLNSIGDSTTRMTVGGSQFQYWIVANKDFIHITTLVGTTYSHYYSGIINRFAPSQNSSLYGQSQPSPSNTTTSIAPFVIGSNTTLYLRTGFDNVGGFDANNACFVPGQLLYIVDQSLGTSTVGNMGIVVLNSVDTVLNSINVSTVSGSTMFSSFAVIGVDPQPVALSTNGIIRGSSFLMVDDFVGDPSPAFNAANEFASTTGLPTSDIQNPDLRNVFITYPIRLFNTDEIRGTLYGMIDVPVSSIGSQDIMKTFDSQFQFIAFEDNSGSNLIALGSII